MNFDPSSEFTCQIWPLLENSIAPVLLPTIDCILYRFVVQTYHKRFSKNEEEILYKEMLHHWEELFGERRKLLPRGGRSAIWDAIATKLNACSGSPVARGGEDVRKKWCHLRKQKLHKEPLQEQPGERGSAGDDLGLLRQRVVSRMERDAAEGKTGTSESECPQLPFVSVSLWAGNVNFVEVVQ